MKLPSHIKKAIQLIFFLGLIALASPYILDKLDFYGISHASTPSTSDKTISSTTLNTPISYADAVALAAPAVVSIKTTKEISMELILPYGGNGNEPPKEILEGLGSGVIVNGKGYILTNNHVIKEADGVMVTLADGRTADGKVVGADPDTDLAVLKINLDKLPVITMGSSQKLRAGDVVLAIGNPLGLDNTVSLGIISATKRMAPADIGLLENLIQTDATINPGNSGGALIDSLGHLVGINTAVIYANASGANSGFGLAIPIDEAIDIMNTLIEGKKIVRGYLGIVMQPLNKEIREYINYKEGDGVYVRAVVRGSPAQKANLLPGDVIIKINNTSIKEERMALRLVAGLTPGQSYPVEIFRKGDYLTFTISLGERKQLQPPKRKE